jgi:2-haloacid dehalogenase
MSSSPPTGIQALIFDTYGTVADWRTTVLEALRALGRSRGLAIDWEAFLTLWETRAILDRVNTGELPWMTMESVHRLVLQTPLARYGVTGLTDDEIDQLVLARWRLQPWPDSVPGLTRLKRRCVIRPLSNASFIGMVKLAKFAGLPWDCIITAENARRYKPHPEAHRTAVSLLGLRPEQVMLGPLTTTICAQRRATASAPRSSRGPRSTDQSRRPISRRKGEWSVIAKDFLDLAGQLGA